MKKILKTVFVFAFGLLFLPKMVFAEGKEIVVDYTKIYEDESNMTLLQGAALDYLSDTGYLTYRCVDSGCSTHMVSTSTGKDLFYYDSDEKVHMADGITSADSFRVEIDHEISTSGVTPKTGMKVFKKVGASPASVMKYDSIYVILGEPLPVPETDTLEIDFYNMNEIMEDITLLQYDVIDLMLDLDKFIIREGKSIETEDGKKLFDLVFDGSSSTTPSRMILAEGLTYKDNFEYVLTDEDIDYLYGNVPYQKVVFKFGEKPGDTPKPDDTPTPKPDDKPPIVNPNTFNNFFYILLILGLVLIIGKKYLLKASK